jgi:hypothetical protein
MEVCELAASGNSKLDVKRRDSNNFIAGMAGLLFG